MSERQTHEYHPNHSTSTPLVEIRTLLSRARTAQEVLDANPDFIIKDGTWRTGEEAETVPHPEIEEMQAAVRAFIAATARWERRGNRRGA